MSTFGSQVVATSLEGDVHHIICAADIVINEIRDVLLKDNERLRDQLRRLTNDDERKREVTMEWKAMEIERLNDLLIKQANVIEKIQDERDALKADAERYRWLRRDPVAGSLYVTSDDDPSIWIRGDDLDAAIDAARGE